MCIENSEYDVVEMDFPEYEEEFSPIGTVAAERSFSSNKTEIYRRNTELALTEQKKALAEERARKFAKQTEYEQMYREAEEMIKQTKAANSLANILSPAGLMNFISGFNRTVDLNRSTKIGVAITAIAAIFLGALIDYVLKH